MTAIRFSTFRATVIAALPLVLSSPAWAAGNHAGGHGHGQAAAIGEAGKATHVTRTVGVTMGDNFFEPESITAKAGETVRFVVKNGGEFLHEFNIATPAMHAAHQKEMAAMAEHGMLTPTEMKTEMPHMDHSKMGSAMPMMTHDDPNSILLKPGETRELIWKFADTTGLEFACNVPGHYESGMVGKVVLGR